MDVLSEKRIIFPRQFSSCKTKAHARKFQAAKRCVFRLLKTSEQSIENAVWNLKFEQTTVTLKRRIDELLNDKTRARIRALKFWLFNDNPTPINTQLATLTTRLTDVISKLFVLRIDNRRGANQPSKITCFVLFDGIVSRLNIRRQNSIGSLIFALWICRGTTLIFAVNL